MLPAKFRGFASRVGRLASRALVWHKTSERDAAVRTSSTTVISSSNASTFGTASTSFDKAVISDSAANSDNVTTIARTAHPAHTLRRALFAMFVAAATIVTMLIVPPMKEANAANVSWDYIGNGYISPNSVASYDVYRDFDVQSPDINTVTVNGKKKTTITWNVLFNANGCRIKKIENPNVDCDENTALHAYVGRPDFYLILPKNIKDNSIRITRYRTKFAGYRGRGKRFVWEERGKDQIPSDFNSYTNATRLPGDSDYENFWKASIEKCGLGTDATCEVDTWRRAGNFGRLFKSWEQDNAVDSIRWIVTAEVEEGSDPYKLPFMAGWISYYGDKHKFTVFGPYDHDGDGIPDLEEFKYGLNPKNDDDIQFPKRSKEDAVYGEVTSVKPYINTGEWVGDSYNGDFKYYKDMPNHGGRTTSEMIPTDAGIEFTFKKNEIGNSEILPPGVTKTYSPNNMQPGQAYINPRTGEVKYSPKASDRNKTIHFDVQINYPDPKPNNCKMNNSIVKVKGVDIHVVSQASRYNPQYDKVYVQAGGKSKESAAPVSHSGANGVKGNDKSQQELVQNGTRLPKGTWFELRIYPKDNEHVLTWYKFVNKQSNKKSGKDEPEDSTTDARYGKVTFSPEKTVMLGEYFAPVIVHYPDGSTSEDPDSGNLGKPVYAPVEVTSQPIQKNDLKLNVYSQYGGRRIENNDKNGMRFRKDEVLGDATGNTKPMFFDSWSSAKQGKIYQRMLCYKKNPQTGKPESYEIDGINGLTLAGRKGNTTSGEFIDKQPSQWTRATEKNKYECTVYGKNCNRNLYLYGDEHDTVERTWGWLHGKVKENGDFVCTVYAIKDLENKDGKHGDLQNKFDKAVNDFVKKPADRKFEEVIKSVLTDKPGSEDSPQEATQRHIDWDSVTFPIHVHSDAHYYNPEYKTISMEAGTKQATEVPKSKKNANDANTLQDDVREGDLPDGTWFKFKKSLSYTFFEDDQDNKADSGDSAKNGTGQFGKVTFRPHKWFPVGSDKVQVIVHYPDGSTSEDKDSGNLGKPIYAKVDITRSHDEDAGNLRLNVGDREGSGDWNDTTIKLTKGEELSTSKKTTRWLDSWSKYKPGKINLRTICNKINSDGTKSHYQSGGIAGITMQDVKIWDHTEDASAQKACEKDASQCHPDRQLYDDYIANGNSKDTTERTRGWIKGKANESGDYECVVYAIKAKQFSKDNNDLLTRFDAAVGALNKDASKNNTDPLKDFKWKLDGNNGNKNAVKGVDYEYRSIPIHIHNDNHFYNPKYVDVSVTAGQKVENAVPQSVKSANGADKYQDVVKAGALPDGTWFEFKDATNGFEVNADGTAGNKVSLDWSYWASNNAADKTGEQSNKPDNPSKQKNGKHSSKDDGTRYGKVTFHPDQSVAPKAYLKEIVIHYPDGSTSDDSDSGNNGKPVYAKVTVGGLSGADKDLKMTLLRSQDADPVHDTLGSGNSLTVMSGTSLTKNPYVLAWSLKDRSNISLRMMCAKQGEQKWSRGLDDTLNMHLNQNYGESVKPWAFANADQRKSCSQDSKNCMANLLYGFTKDKDPNSIESAVSRSEDDIAGVPQKAGNYTCAVFALKPNALTVFNNTVNGSLIEGNKYSSTNMQTTQLAGVTVGKDWNRIAVNVTVIDPPKFALPKTGGMNWNVLLGAFAVIGTGVMAAGFFLEQTKWGRAMLEALLRKTLIKDFICKTAKKLRALRRRSERWRC